MHFSLLDIIIDSEGFYGVLFFNMSIDSFDPEGRESGSLFGIGYDYMEHNLAVEIFGIHINIFGESF